MRSEGYGTWSVDFSPRLRDKIWEWPGDEAMSVTQHLTFHVFIRATNDTNLLGGG